MVNTTSAGLVGVFLLARHGDRSGVVFQNYTTYNSTQGYLTPYGSSQEYDLGCFLRETYLNPASPSYIQGINTDVVDIDQLFVRADAGGGNVILDSAYALLQGLYPPTSESTSILGNVRLLRVRWEGTSTSQWSLSSSGRLRLLPVGWTASTSNIT